MRPKKQLRLVILILMVLSYGPYFHAIAEEVVAEIPRGTLAIEAKDQLKSGNGMRFRMGERLVIKATGHYMNDIKKTLDDTYPGNALSFYFDGTKIPDIPIGIVSQSDNEVLLYVDLVREALNESNRKAWDSLLKHKDNYEMKFKPSLLIGKGLPSAIGYDEESFIFYVGSKGFILGTLIACLLAFFIGFYLLTRTRALRDGSSTAFFSLGKSQMAFWGLLVMLAFVGVWVVNGTMEQIPEQMLMLLGISGGTGLGALIIGESKKSTKAQKVVDLQMLQKELIIKRTGAIASAAEIARLDQLPDEIKQLVESSPIESTGSFWRDICDDGNGLSFHRLQVVLWTLILGTIFVVSVVQLMSMPEFPGSLLILMGVSNVTYLGFKIPEK